MTRFSFAFMAALLFSGALVPVDAAASQKRSSPKNSSARIAATVNNKVITEKDLNYRIKLALISMNLPINSENIKQVRTQILDTLIQELVKLQLTEEFKIDVEETAVQASIRQIENLNNMAEGGFKKMLSKKGIPYYVMEQNIKSSLIWNDFIKARYGDSIRVTPDDIDRALDELKSSLTETRYHLAEIILPIDHKNTAEKRLRQAQKIANQLKKGAQFSILASQFSNAPSAARGGDIGWVPQSKFLPEEAKELAHVKEGGISNPFKSRGAVRLYFVRDKLSPGQFSKPSKTVSFKQVFVANPEDAFAFEIEDNIKQVAAIAQQIRSCRSVERLVKSKKGHVQFVKKVPLQNLNTALKKIINGTSLNRASKPVYTGNGALFFVICDRQTSNPKAPNRDDIQAQLLDKQLQNISQQELMTRVASAHIERR